MVLMLDRWSTCLTKYYHLDRIRILSETFFQFKKQGILCRAGKTDCDVPEYCTGDSRDVGIFNTNKSIFN